MMPKLSDIPTGAEFGQFRSSLARLKDAEGRPIWKQQQMNEALGVQVNGRNWAELQDELRAYLKAAQKAES